MLFRSGAVLIFLTVESEQELERRFSGEVTARFGGGVYVHDQEPPPCLSGLAVGEGMAGGDGGEEMRALLPPCPDLTGFEGCAVETALDCWDLAVEGKHGDAPRSEGQGRGEGGHAAPRTGAAPPASSSSCMTRQELTA